MYVFMASYSDNHKAEKRIIKEKISVNLICFVKVNKVLHFYEVLPFKFRMYKVSRNVNQFMIDSTYIVRFILVKSLKK